MYVMSLKWYAYWVEGAWQRKKSVRKCFLCLAFGMVGLCGCSYFFLAKQEEKDPVAARSCSGSQSSLWSLGAGGAYGRLMGA